MRSIYNHQIVRQKLSDGLNSLLTKINLGVLENSFSYAQFKEGFNGIVESSIRKVLEDMISHNYLLKTGVTVNTRYVFNPAAIDRLHEKGSLFTAEYYINQLEMSAKKHAIEGIQKSEVARLTSELTRKNKEIETLRARITELEMSQKAVKAALTVLKNI